MLTLTYAGVLKDLGWSSGEVDHHLRNLALGPWRLAPSIELAEIVSDRTDGDLRPLLRPGDAIRLVVYDARPAAQILGLASNNVVYVGAAEAAGPRWDAGEAVYYAQFDGLVGERLAFDSLRHHGYEARPRHTENVVRSVESLRRALAEAARGAGAVPEPSAWHEMADEITAMLTRSVRLRCDATTFASANKAEIERAMAAHWTALAGGLEVVDTAPLEAALRALTEPLHASEREIRELESSALTTVRRLDELLATWCEAHRSNRVMEGSMVAVAELRRVLARVAPRSQVGTDGLIRRLVFPNGPSPQEDERAE
ncbi:MAG: hypothetical protein IPG96_07070 [Proteobacteria bacterium]|nr:hypothetical protein [Pseudomonadota bacterium]